MKDVRFPLFCLLATGLMVCGCGSTSTVSNPPPQTYTVSVSAQRAALATTQKYSITATTNDTSGVSWTATGGSFSSETSLTGVAVTYTAPGTAGSYTITAKSESNSSDSATMTVYVTDLAGVTTYHNDLRAMAPTAGICVVADNCGHLDLWQIIQLHHRWRNLYAATVDAECDRGYDRA